MIDTWDLAGAMYARRFFKCPDLAPDFVVNILIFHFEIFELPIFYIIRCRLVTFANGSI